MSHIDSLRDSRWKASLGKALRCMFLNGLSIDGPMSDKSVTLSAQLILTVHHTTYSKHESTTNTTNKQYNTSFLNMFAHSKKASEVKQAVTVGNKRRHIIGGPEIEDLSVAPSPRQCQHQNEPVPDYTIEQQPQDQSKAGGTARVVPLRNGRSFSRPTLRLRRVEGSPRVFFALVQWSSRSALLRGWS